MPKKPTRANSSRVPIAVVTADAHLQDRAWQSRPTLEGDAYYAFEWLVDYVCDHARRLPLIGAGDLIDKQKNEARVVRFIREQCAKLDRAVARFLFIEGDHDAQRGTRWMTAAHHWPTSLHREIWPLDEYRCYGIDWTAPDMLQQELDQVPTNIDILVMHQKAHEFLGGVTQAELRWDMIPGHVKMLIVGDYHVHTRLLRANRDGHDLIVLSPGSTCLQAIDEPYPKHFFVLYDDLSTESVEIPGRPFLRPPVLHTAEDLDSFVTQAKARCEEAGGTAEGLPDALRKPILYVRYAWDLPNAHKRMAQAVGESAHLFLKEILPEPDPEAVEVRERKQVIEGGLNGALPQLVPDTDSELFHLASNLLDATDPKHALLTMRKDHLD